MKQIELEKELRALRYPKVPPELSDKLLSLIPKNNFYIGAFIMKLSFVVILITITLFTFITPDNILFAQVIEKIQQTKAIYIEYQILGREGENFEYVNLGGKLMYVNAWIKLRKERNLPDLAKLDKKDRTLYFDGKDFIIYFKRAKEATKINLKVKDFRGVAGFKHVLLPSDIIKFFYNSHKHKRKIMIKDVMQSGRKLKKAVITKKTAYPDDKNPHFVQDFDQEVSVMWDQETKELLSMNVYLHHKGKKILFLRTTKIEYPKNLQDNFFQLKLPKDGMWTGYNEPKSKAYKNISPEEVTRRFFQAAQQHDWKTLKIFCKYNAMVKAFKKMKIEKIHFIGKAFKGVMYPGRYVPYEITLRVGKRVFRKKHNLALKYKKKYSRWVFDGGF